MSNFLGFDFAIISRVLFFEILSGCFPSDILKSDCFCFNNYGPVDFLLQSKIEIMKIYFSLVTISLDFLNEFVVLATHPVFTKKFSRATFHAAISRVFTIFFRALFIYYSKNQNYARNFSCCNLTSFLFDDNKQFTRNWIYFLAIVHNSYVCRSSFQSDNLEKKCYFQRNML